MNPVNKILLGAGAGIALIFLVTLFWFILSNAHLKIALAQAQENNTACHLANDEFTQQVARQNKAVENMRAQAAAQEIRAQAREFAAQKTMRSYYLAADRTSAEKRTGDACRAANEIFNDYLKQKQ